MGGIRKGKGRRERRKGEKEGWREQKGKRDGGVERGKEDEKL